LITLYMCLCVCVCVCVQIYIYIYMYISCGPGSSVGIATDYGLDGEIFRTRLD
jgi:hypothetical protein